MSHPGLSASQKAAPPTGRVVQLVVFSFPPAEVWSFLQDYQGLAYLPSGKRLQGAGD
jgi:hypothetical protein